VRFFHSWADPADLQQAPASYVIMRAYYKFWNIHEIYHVIMHERYKLFVSQLIVDRVEQNLENILKNFQFSTRRTRILMECIIDTIYWWVLLLSSMGRILVRWKNFRSDFEIRCQPICNRLYKFVIWIIYVQVCGTKIICNIRDICHS